MLRTVAVFGIFGSFALVAASVVGSVGCSSSSSSGTGSTSSADTVDCEDGGCTACTGPTATAATVSFATTIQPILRVGCGTGGNTCHGQYPGSASAANEYLAEPTANDDGNGDAGAILSGIVGVKAIEAPSLDIVKAGDPEDSYLMHKIDGDMCALMSPANECAAIAGLQLPNATITAPCGVPMPQNSQPLTVEQRTEIWNWIAQGANNN
jgi:hypothetical protein